MKSHPQFKADPIIRPFELAPILQDVKQLCETILNRVGAIKQYILYPHRIFKQRAWHIKIIGESTTTYLLLNISGYYQFTSDMNATRLSMSVVDDIDAFWLSYLLADRLAVVPSIPKEIFDKEKV